MTQTYYEYLEDNFGDKLAISYSAQEVLNRFQDYGLEEAYFRNNAFSAVSKELTALLTLEHAMSLLIGSASLEVVPADDKDYDRKATPIEEAIYREFDRPYGVGNDDCGGYNPSIVKLARLEQALATMQQYAGEGSKHAGKFQIARNIPEAFMTDAEELKQGIVESFENCAIKLSAFIDANKDAMEPYTKEYLDQALQLAKLGVVSSKELSPLSGLAGPARSA